MINKLQNTIELLQTKSTGDVKHDLKLSDYIGCLLDIQEDLEYGAMETFDHINYKLYTYFGDEYAFVGQPGDFEPYVSPMDMTLDNLYWAIDLALEVLNKKYN